MTQKELKTRIAETKKELAAEKKANGLSKRAVFLEACISGCKKDLENAMANMKVAEMNARQKKAFFNIKNAANWIIGGLENTLDDNDPDSKEYKDAAAALTDYDALVQTIYDAATTELYGGGSCCFGSGAAKALKDIRFCGKDFLMAHCRARVNKLGY